MLRQKQIPEELIHFALSRIDDDFYRKILFELLKTKIKSVKGVHWLDKILFWMYLHGPFDLQYRVSIFPLHSNYWRNNPDRFLSVNQLTN